MGIRHSKRLLAHLSNLDAHNTLMLFSRVLCRSVQCVVLVPRTEPRREAWWPDFPTIPKRWGTLGWRRWAPPNLSDDFPINFPINWPSCSISFSVKKMSKYVNFRVNWCKTSQFLATDVGHFILIHLDSRPSSWSLPCNRGTSCKRRCRRDSAQSDVNWIVLNHGFTYF